MSHRLANPKFLLSHWPLNNHADDLIRGNNGTWAGNETYVDGPFSRKSAEFDGTGDQINVGTSPWFTDSSVEMSVALWAYIDPTLFNAAVQMLVDTSGGSPTSNNGFWIGVDDRAGVNPTNGIQFAVATAASAAYRDIEADNLFSEAGWYHIVCTYRGGTGRIYLNGEDVTDRDGDTSLGTGNFTPRNADLYIGSLNDGTNDFDGDMADVRIYNVALTGDEALALYRMRPPQIVIAEQPIPQIPDVADADLQGAWLNRAVVGTGDDLSDQVGDLAIVGALPFPRIGAGPFTTSNYLRGEKAANADFNNWRSGDSVGTITAWIKLASVGSNHIIFSSANEIGTDDHFYLAVISSDVLQFSIKRLAASGVDGSTSLVADRWYFVAINTSGSVWKMWVDAVEETLTPNAGGNTGDWLDTHTNRDNVCIGVLRRSSVLSRFNGEIQDVRYYSRELSQSEITAMYQQGVPDDDLAGLWLPGKGIPNDYSRFRYDMSVVGALPFTRRGSGPFTTANHLKLTATDWQSGDSAGTIMVWANFATLGALQTLWASCDQALAEAAPGKFLMLRVNASDQLEVTQNDAGTADTVTGGTTLVINRWYLLTLVSTGTAYLLYVNGVAEGLTVNSGLNTGDWLADTSARDNLTIGVDETTSVANPTLGELSVMPYAKVARGADYLKAYYERMRGFF